MALRSKHSLGMTALICPLVGSVGAFGSRGLYGVFHMLNEVVRLFASDRPPFPILWILICDEMY